MKKTLLICATLLFAACSSAGEKMPVQEGLEVYENSLYSLQYPSEWKVDEEQQGTGGPATGIRTDLSYLAVDSPACPDEMISVSIETGGWWDAGFFSDFDSMIKSDAMYNGMDATLGKWSGDLVKMKIGGKSAYQVDSLGWEVACDSKDYIVETDSSGRYMTIQVSAGAAAGNDDLVQQVLDSIQFKK